MWGIFTWPIARPCAPINALLGFAGEIFAVATEQRVFISYSRKDYYFAESLAFHLMTAGFSAWLDVKDLVPGTEWRQEIDRAIDEASCFIVVVSPDSLQSETVRCELQRAKSQGKRMIAVLFRRRSVPADWGIVEAVDFRGAFEPALGDLKTQLLAPSADTAPGCNPMPRFRFSPWLAGTGLCLLTLLLILFLICWRYPDFLFDAYDTVFDYSLNENPQALRHWLGERGFHVFLISLFAIIFGTLLHFGVFEFFYRRMSMTRLLLVFAFVLYTIGYALSQHAFGAAIPPLSPPFVIRAMEANWPASLWVMLAGMAACTVGIAIVLRVRPSELLHWTPTGQAWLSYRDMHRPGSDLVGMGHQSLATLKRFMLLHDHRDGPLAERLRQGLCTAGAVDSKVGEDGVIPVLVLTNCSSVQWIEQQIESVRGEVLTLIATHLRPPAALEWLWRVHWIDFRGWPVQSLSDRNDRLPSIPEALLVPRYPAAVRSTHLGLSALCALLFQTCTMGFGVSPLPSITPLFGSLGTAFANLFAVLVVPFLWVIPARKLLNRTCTVGSFFGSIGVCSVSTGLAAIWKLKEYPMHDSHKVLAAAFLLIGLMLWTLRQRHELTCWFPLAAKPGTANSFDLAPTKNHQTLFWFFVFFLIWSQVFGQGMFAKY
ncbi:MAG: toll/interleukin-1 receptor domain-containing protein [Methylococcaceae bacterium]|nr:toll/interleukin-1 receptor domain-containing protein [Methylococcaceae bacterium]